MIVKHNGNFEKHQVEVDLGPYPEAPGTDWHALARLAEAEAAERCATCFHPLRGSARAQGRMRFTPYGEEQQVLRINVLVGGTR